MNQTRRREETFKRLFMTQFYPEDSFEDVVKANDELETLDPEADIHPYIEPELGNGIKEADLKLINDKVEVIREHLKDIDDLINANVTGWKTSRMAKVDLTILRLACYELKYDDTIPTKVSVNEAVELAKKYGTEKSGSFVNGVLRHIIIALDSKPEEKTPEEDSSEEKTDE